MQKGGLMQISNILNYKGSNKNNIVKDNLAKTPTRSMFSVSSSLSLLSFCINKIIFPDKTEVPINAYVTNNSSNVLGGELTAPMEYTRIPHYIYYPRVYKGVLQYVPGNKRYFGHHLVVKPGAELIIQLEEDFNAIVTDF